MVVNLHRWPNNFNLQSVRTNLGGASQHWITSRNNKSWIDFERQFHRAFIRMVITIDHFANIFTRKLICVKCQIKPVGMFFHKSKMQILEGLFLKT